MAARGVMLVRHGTGCLAVFCPRLADFYPIRATTPDEREMVRRYTLIPEDLALINRRRGDPNRLGFALMLCYLTDVTRS